MNHVDLRKDSMETHGQIPYRFSQGGCLPGVKEVLAQ